MSTWILLRGLTREGRHWGEFRPQWQRAFPEDQVIALELPGNGVLNACSSPMDMAALVTHCRSEVTRLDLQPPVRVLAMSLGAMVAAAWAERHPGDLAGCVFINTSFGGFSPFHQRMRPRAWPLLARLLLARTPARRERLIFELTSRLATDSAQVVNAWTAIRQSHPVRLSNALRQVFAAARFRAPRTAGVPTLVLASGGDGLVDVRCSQEIARRWNCPLAIHPTAGHDLPLDAGDWVADRVREWLEASAPGTSHG